MLASSLCIGTTTSWSNSNTLLSSGVDLKAMDRSVDPKQDFYQSVLNNINLAVHAPGHIRANGTVRNQQGFYEAFAVKEGDKMYIEPEKRISIW